MERRSCGRLLSALAYSALAACQAGEDCVEVVELEGPARVLSPDEVCKKVSAIGENGGWSKARYGIARDKCSELCADGRSDTCGLPADYEAAFQEVNGQALNWVLPGAITPAAFQCPAWSAEITVTCSLIEWRRNHPGCTVE